jgi:hypothetical protein
MKEEEQEPEIIETAAPEEEPWCLHCHRFSDYRKKWDTIRRSDLEGGAYSENVEVPHCIACEKPMLFLSTAKRLTWSVYALSTVAWLLGLCSVLFLFGLSLGSIIGLIVLGGFCYLVSRLPQKSRQALQSHLKARKEESLKNLLQKL